MANYSVYAGAVEPYPPYSNDGVNYFFPIASQVVVVADDDSILFPWAMDPTITPPAMAICQMQSADGFVHTDTQDTLQAKLLTALYMNYPTIDPTDDVINWVWIC